MGLQQQRTVLSCSLFRQPGARARAMAGASGRARQRGFGVAAASASWQAGMAQSSMNHSSSRSARGLGLGRSRLPGRRQCGGGGRLRIRTSASILGVGTPEVLVIGVVALLVFGPKVNDKNHTEAEFEEGGRAGAASSLATASLSYDTASERSHPHSRHLSLRRSRGLIDSERKKRLRSC